MSLFKTIENYLSLATTPDRSVKDLLESQDLEIETNYRAAWEAEPAPVNEPEFTAEYVFDSKGRIERINLSNGQVFVPLKGDKRNGKFKTKTRPGEKTLGRAKRRRSA